MKNKINVMHIVLSLEFGGAEKLVLDLSSQINKERFTPSICCLDNLGVLADSARSRGINVVLIKRKPGKDLLLFFKLAALFKKKNIQVAHTHNLGPLIYGTLAARMAGVSVVINTRHGRERKKAFPFIWNMNDAIIAVSEDAKREMLKCNEINSGKVRVIYNGVDLKRFEAYSKKLTLKEKLHLPAGCVVAGTVGRLSAEKDQHTLIESFSIINKDINNAYLVIVGDGILRKDLENHALALGVEKKVKFLGFRNDINIIVRIFDIFVLSSLQEGVSLSLLEAMASGKPTVATNVGGNSEVVIDGETGILVPPKNPEKMAQAVIKVIQNPELAKKMGEAGRMQVEEKFSLEHMGKKYMDLYEECLEKKHKNQQ